MKNKDKTSNFIVTSATITTYLDIFIVNKKVINTIYMIK